MLSNKSSKIKVYFIVQYIQGLDKIHTVIQIMQKDPMINVKVLAFPSDKNDFPENKELSFWREKIGNNVINAVVENGWYDLKKQKPDYVFVQRPYDIYLPKEYSVKELSSFTKVCYIPYGFTLHTRNDLVLYNSFLEELSIFFAENNDQYKYVKKIFGEMKDKKSRKSVFLGYPSLDNMEDRLKKEASAFSESNKYKIIWAPRWTTDDSICGTSFFDYKDKVIKYAEMNKDIEMVFRPHPLIFKNFIDKKQMTKNEVKLYLKALDDNKIIYDKDSEYMKTLSDADVLVIDFSSIIVEYLYFENPIILCKRNEKYSNIYMKKISGACYLVDNWEQLEKVLNNLKNGIDPLKLKRKRIRKKIFKIYDGNVANNIVEYIKKDYYDN